MPNVEEMLLCDLELFDVCAYCDSKCLAVHNSISVPVQQITGSHTQLDLNVTLFNIFQLNVTSPCFTTIILSKQECGVRSKDTNICVNTYIRNAKCDRNYDSYICVVDNANVPSATQISIWSVLGLV